jgi:hypothetical protein
MRASTQQPAEQKSPEAPVVEVPVDDRSEEEKKIDENTFSPQSFSI